MAGKSYALTLHLNEDLPDVDPDRWARLQEWLDERGLAAGEWTTARIPIGGAGWRLDIDEVDGGLVDAVVARFGAVRHSCVEYLVD